MARAGTSPAPTETRLAAPALPRRTRWLGRGQAPPLQKHVAPALTSSHEPVDREDLSHLQVPVQELPPREPVVRVRLEQVDRERPRALRRADEERARRH